MPNSCIVPKCNMVYKNIAKKCSLFKVPINKNVREKWQNLIPNMKIALKESHRICENHFEPKWLIKKYVKQDHNGKIIAQVI